jgi:hypothetical protein
MAAARRPRGGGGGGGGLGRLLPPLLALALLGGACAASASASAAGGVGTTTAASPFLGPASSASFHDHDHAHSSPSDLPCGHSRVAHISRRLSELHSEQQERDRRRRRSRALLEEPPSPPTDDDAPWLVPSNSTRRRLQQDDATNQKQLPIRIWVEYQGVGELSDAQRDKLTRTVGLALGVLRKYLAVRRPVAGRLRVRPLCVMWSSAGYCLKYSPDVMDGGGGDGSGGSGGDKSIGSTAAGPGAAVSMSTFFGGGMGGGSGGPLFGSDGEALPTLGKENNQCGLASINATHVAPYRQCALGGGGCREYAGGEGEPTDYYLYVTAVQDEHCRSGAVAWGLPCLYDQDTNRPVLGSANMCPYALQEGGASPGRDQSVAVLVHELMHALVGQIQRDGARGEKKKRSGGGPPPRAP